jgi:hypothetical protein
MDLSDYKKEIPDIFEKVKKDVKKIYGRQRAGLTLGLVEMGMYQGGFIGGMHFHPGTDIIMNKAPLRMIIKEQPQKVVWGYIYHILLHEYIHSLGVFDERQCRILTLEVTEAVFGETSHPAMIFTKKGIGAYFPNLRLIYSWSKI